jgi:translocation protein SEC63
MKPRPVLEFNLWCIFFLHTQGKWWHGSRKYTKDQVLAESASRYFLNLTEETKFANAVEVLSSSLEFKALESKYSRVFESNKSYKKLEDQVTTTLFNSTGEKLEGRLYNNNNEKFVKRTAVLIYAHLFRIPISDVAVLKGSFNSFYHTNLDDLLTLATSVQPYTFSQA